MHVERIRFDRVFDAVEGSGDFSFDSAGRRVYAANLGPGTVPRQGATYAIAFARAGDWRSVLGWRDLDTDTVGFRQRPRDPFWLDIDIDIFIFLAALPVALLVLLGPLAGGCALVVLLGLVHACRRGVQRRKEAVRARLLQEAR